MIKSLIKVRSEMRTTPTNVKGKIGLIESGSGLIVGEANLTGCYHKPIKPNDKYLIHKIKNIKLLKNGNTLGY